MARSAHEIAADLLAGLSNSTASTVAIQLSCLLAVNNGAKTDADKEAVKSVLAARYPDETLFAYDGDFRGEPLQSIRMVNVQREKLLDWLKAQLA